MNSAPPLAMATDAERYVAVFRSSTHFPLVESRKSWHEFLLTQLRDLTSFDHLDALILKEDSNEIEWQVWGTEPIAFPDLPVEETSTWHVFRTQEPLYVADWNTDDRFPRVKRLLEMAGAQDRFCHSRAIDHSVPALRNAGYRQPGSQCLRFGGRLLLAVAFAWVALAIDDALNLRKSRAARLKLERQNTRLKLLLDMTNRITSNLDLDGPTPCNLRQRSPGHGMRSRCY